MPTFPVEQTGISQNVPSFTPAVMNESSRALAEVSGIASKVSLDAANMFMKLEADSAVQRARTEQQIAINKKIEELNALPNSQDGLMRDNNGKLIFDSETGNARTITDEYKEWADNTYKNYQEQMPNGLAQRMYRESVQGDMLNGYNTIDASYKTKVVAARKSSYLQSVEAAAQSIAINPNIRSVYDHIATNTSALTNMQGLVFQHTEFPEEHRKLQNTLSTSYFKGLITNVNAALERDNKSNGGVKVRSDLAYYGLSMLEGRDMRPPGPDGKPLPPDPMIQAGLIEMARAAKGGQTPLNKLLDSDQYVQIKSRLYELTKIAVKTDKESLNRELQIYKAYASMNGTDQKQRAIESRIFEAAQLQDTRELQENLINTKVWAAIGDYTKSPSFPDEVSRNNFHQKNIDSFYRIGKQFGDDSLAARAIEMYKNSVHSHDEKVKEEFEKDPYAAAYSEVNKRTGSGEKNAPLAYRPAVPNMKDLATAKPQQLEAGYGQTKLVKQLMSSYGNIRAEQIDRTMTNQEAKDASDVLQDPNRSPESTVTYINNLKALKKEHFTGAVDDMVKYGALNPKWRWLSLLPSDEVTLPTMVIAIKTGDKNLNTVRQIFKDKSGDPGVLDRIVRDKMVNINDSIGKAWRKNPNHAMLLQEGANDYIKNIVAYQLSSMQSKDGAFDTSSVEKLVDGALDSSFNRYFTEVPVSGGDGESTLILPKNIVMEKMGPSATGTDMEKVVFPISDFDKQKITKFTDDVVNGDWQTLEKNGVVPPKGFDLPPQLYYQAIQGLIEFEMSSDMKYLIPRAPMLNKNKDGSYTRSPLSYPLMTKRGQWMIPISSIPGMVSLEEPLKTYKEDTFGGNRRPQSIDLANKIISEERSNTPIDSSAKKFASELTTEELGLVRNILLKKKANLPTGYDTAIEEELRKRLPKKGE